MNSVWLGGSVQEMKVSKLWLALSEGQSSLRERIRDVRKGPGKQPDSVTMLAVEGELKSKNEMCFSRDTSFLSFFRMKSVLTGLTYSLGLASHSEDEI